MIQFFCTQKIFAAKQYEAWQMIRRHYCGTGLSKTYDPYIDELAKDSLKALNRYFGKDNIISRVRNFYTFHYDPEQIEETINIMEDGDEFDMYIAQKHINSMYYISETIINKSMLFSENEDMNHLYDEFHRDISRIHSLILNFINDFLQKCMARNFPISAENSSTQEIDPQDILKLKDLQIPFFFET